MSNNITLLLQGVCAGGLADLENAMTALLTQRGLDNAVGAQLVIIAKIVGQPIAGLTDDQIRVRCKARVAAHRSKTNVADIIRVAKLLAPEGTKVRLSQDGPATLRVFLDEVAVDADTAAIIFFFEQIAHAAGVRLVLQWMESDPAGIFRLDSGPGLDQGRLSGDEG